MGRIIDISQSLRPGMAVWPGDAEYRAFWTGTVAQTGSVNIGGVSLSLHAGTHADAPKHFEDRGRPIDEVDPEIYVGEAVVIDLGGIGAEALNEGITSEMLRDNLPDGAREIPPRVLLRTLTGGSGEVFPEAFAHLTAESAQWLAEAGVRLAGIDTPSIERVDSKDMQVHKILADRGIAILENLALAHVKPGRYELIALPLKFAGMDASPVRAVLREID